MVTNAPGAQVPLSQIADVKLVDGPPMLKSENARLNGWTFVDIRGTVAVCGHNHRIDTPPGTALPGCSPAWDEPSGNLIGVMTTGGEVLTKGTTDVLGSPSPTDTDPTNQFQTLAQALGLADQELRDILANADRNALDGVGRCRRHGRQGQDAEAER